MLAKELIELLKEHPEEEVFLGNPRNDGGEPYTGVRLVFSMEGFIKEGKSWEDSPAGHSFQRGYDGKSPHKAIILTF